MDGTFVFQPDLSVPASSLVGLIATSPPFASTPLISDRSIRFRVDQTGATWSVPNVGSSGYLLGANEGDWAYTTATTYYVNGVASNLLASGWNIFGGGRTNTSAYFPSTFPYHLGTSGLGSRGFKGKIAVALLYNKILSAAEQAQNFKALSGRFGIANGGGNLTIRTNKGARLGGIVSGTGAITKTGADTLIIEGPNNYTGATFISTGAVEIKNAAAFGTASGTTTVSAGATVQIEGSNLTIPEPITINGDGVVVGGTNQGAIKNIRNLNTLSGLITLGSASTIVSGTLSGTTTDSLLINTAGINTGSYTLTTDVVK
jgi:autotransporter-associated beta strand protein